MGSGTDFHVNPPNPFKDLEFIRNLGKNLCPDSVGSWTEVLPPDAPQLDLLSQRSIRSHLAEHTCHQKLTELFPTMPAFRLLLPIFGFLVISSATRQAPATPPQIVVEPEDTFPLDGILEFTCKGTGYPEPKVTWFDAATKKPLSLSSLTATTSPSSSTTNTNTGVHINQFLGQLTITDPAPRRVFSVYCNISNAAGWQVSRIAYGATAYLDAEFRNVPVDRVFQEGDVGLLECKPPEGQPQPTVEWLFNGRVLPITRGGRMSVTHEGKLHISALQVRDSGQYACRARNTAGVRVSPMAMLTVKHKTPFLVVPQDKTADIGGSVMFACKVNSGQITWRRGAGEPSIDTSRARLIGDHLEIENIQPSDAGTYICVTSDGSVSAKANLYVQNPLAFITRPSNQTVNEGEDVLLLCETSGSPKPSVYWDLPNQRPLFPEDSFENVRLHDNGNLEIRSVRMNNSGVYQCSAHSSYGVIHATAILHVRPLPRAPMFRDDSDLALDGGSSSMHIIPPIISLPPANQTAYAGESVTLDCEVGITRHPQHQQPVSGASERLTLRGIEDSTWEVMWLRGTRSTGGLHERLDFNQPDRFILLPGGSLRITDLLVEDTGNYTCVVQKKLAHDMVGAQVVNWTASLIVVPSDVYVDRQNSMHPPLSPPGNVQVTNITAQSLTLVWDAPDISDDAYRPEISYWIELYHDAQPDRGWQVIQESWAPRTIRLESLQPGGNYYLLVRPRWIDGRIGWASAPLGPIRMASSRHPLHNGRYFTPPAKQDLLDQIRLTKVTALDIQVVSSNTAHVSWSLARPADSISLLHGFGLRYKEVALMNCVSELFSSPSKRQSMQSHKMELSQYCSLSGRPDEKSLLQRIQDFQQQLHAVLPTAQGISLVPQENPDVVKDVPVSGDGNPSGLPIWQTTLTNLKPFRCYSLSVQPYATYPDFGRAAGTQSSSFLFLTHEDQPSQPPVVRGLRRKANHSVEMTWNPPPAESWNGFLTEFHVFIFNAAQNDKRELKFTYGEERGVVGGLKAGEVFHLQMAVVNCKGSSLRSIPLNFSVSAAGVVRESNGLTQLATEINERHDEFPPTRDSTTSKEFLSQSWLIGGILGALIFWVGIIILVILCCLRRQASTKPIFPSVCAGFDGDSGRTCKNSIAVGSGGADTFAAKFKANTAGGAAGDNYHLEPLIKPHSTSGSSELEMTTTTASALNRQTQTVTGSDILKTSSHHTAAGEVLFSPPLMPFPNTTLASSNSSSAGHRTGFDDAFIPMHSSDFSSASPYLTHLPPGQMMPYSSSEFPDHLTYRGPQPPPPTPPTDVNPFATSMMDATKCTLTGLPMVAPVAHLSASNFPASGSEVNSSVTPYATASLINTELVDVALQHQQQQQLLDVEQSRSPSDVASGSSSGGGGGVPAGRRYAYGTSQSKPQGLFHSPQHFGRMMTSHQQEQQPQYQSHSSSGTNTGAEEDYLTHHHHHHQHHHHGHQLQSRSRLKRYPTISVPITEISISGVAGGSEYDHCLPTTSASMTSHAQVS
ncbi:Roundabout 1 [Sparganum proliferum]